MWHLHWLKVAKAIILHFHFHIPVNMSCQDNNVSDSEQMFENGFCHSNVCFLCWFHNYCVTLIHDPKLFITAPKYILFADRTNKFCYYFWKDTQFYSVQAKMVTLSTEPILLLWMPQPHVGLILAVLSGSELGASHILEGRNLSHVMCLAQLVYFWGVAQWPHTHHVSYEATGWGNRSLHVL